VDYRKELGLRFVEYCEVYDGTDNTSKARSIPCVALYPCNNAAGSWAFMNLLSKKIVRRSQWAKMHTSEEFIKRMNGFDGDGLQPIQADAIKVAEAAPAPEPAMAARMPAVPDRGQEPAEVSPKGASENEVQEPVREQEPEQDECPDLEPQDGDDSDSESEDSDGEDEQERPTMRRSARIARGIRPPDKLTMASQKLREGRHNSEEQNESIKRAKISEIKQVLEELMAVEPVLKEDIPEGVRALNCHLFTVEKFKADGSHEKYKSRFVAHGNEQDDLKYPDRLSPTVGVHSIMMGLGVVACNEGYVVGKLDVKGAFIQTEMTGPPVYIKCAGELKWLILEVYPTLRKYVGLDGLLHCKLLKALYGCVQASKLWYEKLRGFLEREGYERSATEPCVFRKVEGQCVYVLLVYVDVILVCAKQKELERMKRAFTSEFEWITADVGDKHSYLGMQLTISKGCIEVNMRFYIEKILAAYGDLR